MKSFYSCVDALVPSPFSEQHLIIRNKAEKENGAITFYGAEEYRSVKSQPFILMKMKETPGLDGVVFFTAQQFAYGSEFNLKLFNELIDNNYEIHFAREDFSFKKNDLNIKNLDFLVSNSLIFHRNENDLIKLF